MLLVLKVLLGPMTSCHALPAKFYQGRYHFLHDLHCFGTNCQLSCGSGPAQPAAEVSYVERIRAMSALFNVGEMATSEVSQAALQAALNSVRDGSIFAANHYADALDIYV